jgi:hypothetical protein
MRQILRPGIGSGRQRRRLAARRCACAIMVGLRSTPVTSAPRRGQQPAPTPHAAPDVQYARTGAHALSQGASARALFQMNGAIVEFRHSVRTYRSQSVASAAKRCARSSQYKASGQIQLRGRTSVRSPSFDHSRFFRSALPGIRGALRSDPGRCGGRNSLSAQPVTVADRHRRDVREWHRTGTAAQWARCSARSALGDGGEQRDDP